MKGIVFDIQRYAIHDGPGIRTTVYMKGCPLTCPWCHNPESLSQEPEIIVDWSRCVACGECAWHCPDHHSEAVAGTGPNHRCIACGICVDICVADARTLLGKRFSASSLIDKIIRDRIFFENSGGGVTFSGGEPFMQDQFLLDCLKACKNAGLHTAVDTSGYTSKEIILESAKYVDLFLFDIKLVDDARHQKATGVPFSQIRENLNALDKQGKEIWVRVPFVPGHNDDEENISAIGTLLSSLRQTRKVHLLPYHRLGSDKHKIRIPEPSRAISIPPTNEEIDKAVEHLSSFGLTVRVGG